MKQVIVMRAELGMSRGKEIAQGAHASMKAVVENIDDPRVIHWLDGRFTKVVLVVNSEEELLRLYAQAKAKNLICALIEDEGLTEFDGVHTNTCISIGPDVREKIDEVTGHLNLR